jgi:hypothetical protein
MQTEWMHGGTTIMHMGIQVNRGYSASRGRDPSAPAQETPQDRALTTERRESFQVAGRSAALPRPLHTIVE